MISIKRGIASMKWLMISSQSAGKRVPSGACFRMEEAAFMTSLVRSLLICEHDLYHHTLFENRANSTQAPPGKMQMKTGMMRVPCLLTRARFHTRIGDQGSAVEEI